MAGLSNEVTMLFKRRNTESFFQRMRVYAWPRRSWRRSTRYVWYRVRRLNATPHAVALGFAAGVFVSCTPFAGVHMLMASGLAWIIGGSIVSAILGTFVGNPLTYPFFWVSSYELGSLILGNKADAKPSDLWAGDFQDTLDQIWPLLKPMTLGSIPIGLTLGGICYVLVRPTVSAYQHRRRTLRTRREATLKAEAALRAKTALQAKTAPQAKAG